MPEKQTDKMISRSLLHQKSATYIYFTACYCSFLTYSFSRARNEKSPAEENIGSDSSPKRNKSRSMMDDPFRFTDTCKVFCVL